VEALKAEAPHRPWVKAGKACVLKPLAMASKARQPLFAFDDRY
jgi:hypothetical protein